VQRNRIGFNIGLNAALGTHFQRLGFNLNFLFIQKAWQFNTELRFYYSLRNLGPKKTSPEMVLSQGVVYGYGRREQMYNPFLSAISNQTGYLNSFAYCYNIFINNILTSQQTGILAFEVQRVSLIAENDLLAKPALDRFRTGAFLLQYQHRDIAQVAINCTMWTGDMGERAGIMDPEFHYRCYMDTIRGVYPNTSHGLLSAQFRYHVGYSQNVQGNIGVDAEQVRNAVQNNFIHDMPFIPRKLNKARNCHIPMIDSAGVQFLYRPEQKIRKPKPFINFFANPNIFY
jgi:hypothetical protein